MRFGEIVKRRLSLLLSIMMTVQLCLPGLAVPAYAETGSQTSGTSNGTIEYDMTSKGVPSDAFTSITLNIEDTVSDISSIKMNVDGVLNADYLNQIYLNWYENGDNSLDEEEFDLNEDNIQDQYATYEEYLNAQKEFPKLSFSWNYDKDLFDIGTGVSGNLYSSEGEYKGEKIGTYEFEEVGGKPTLTVTIDPFVCYRKNVTFNFDIEGDLSEFHQAGDTVVKGDNDGSADVNLVVGGEHPGTGSNAEYKIEKKAVNQNDSEVTTVNGRDLSYILHVTASSSNATSNKTTYATDSNATGSNASGSDANAGIDPSSPDWSGNLYNDVNTEDEDSTGKPTLKGKTIIDVIPEHLKLESVQIGDGSLWYDLTEDEYTYDEESRTLTIDVDKVTIDYKECDIKINTKLDDKTYNEYLMSGEDFSMSFSNKASLKDAEDKTVTVSNRVNPIIKLKNPLEKNGIAVDKTNKKFKWTIKANADFSNEKTKFWVIDHIENINETHTFNIKDGITVGGDSFSIKALNTSDLQGEDYSAYSYELVNLVSNIETVLGVDDNTQAYVYYYHNAKTGKTDAVMLIPLYPNHLNGETEIVYQTDISNKYLIPTNETQKITMKNEAKATWEWPEGEGPGPDQEFPGGSASVSKDVTGKINIISKSAGSYNSDDNILPWTIQLNQMGAAATDVTVTDVFTITSQKLVEPDSTKALDVQIFNPKTYDSENTSYKYNDETIPYWDGTGTKPEKWYYTITTSGNTQTLKIWFKEFKEDEGYKITLKTTVTDTALQSQNQDIKLENTATITGTINETGFNKKADAETTIKNILIQKNSVPFDADNHFYNYSDNTVKWNVKVNPLKWQIKEGVVTDELPLGLSLEAITAIKKNGVSITDFAQNADNQNIWTADGGKITITQSDRDRVNTTELNESNTNYSAKKLVIKFAKEQEADTTNLNTVYEFEFTTRIDDLYRRNEMKSDVETNFENKVTLTGKLPGDTEEEDRNINASDIANVGVRPSNLDKYGKYSSYLYDGQNPKTGYTFTDEQDKVHGPASLKVLSWTAVINRTGVSMKGATVTDIIPDFMELAASSVEVYRAKISNTGDDKFTDRTFVTDGEAIYTSADGLFVRANEEIPDAPTGSKIAYDQFDFVIPDTYDTTPLIIKFDTILVDDALDTEMKNTISVTGADWSDTTESERADGAVSFNVGQYATSEGVYFVKVNKISENQADGGKFPLKGAQFKLEAMKLKDGAPTATDISNYEIDNSYHARLKTTNRRGNANFFFLEPDAIYRVTETVAPTGYELNDKVWYIVPYLKNKTATDFPAEATDLVDPVQNDKKCDVIVNITKDHYKSQTIKDGVTTGFGQISFKKFGQGGQILSGIKFDLTHSQLATKHAISTEDGTVTFGDIDYGTRKYQIVEKTELIGYKALTDAVYAMVSLNEAKTGLDVTFSGPGIKKADDGTWYVTNTPITGSGSWTKKDQLGQTMSGVKFNVKRRGDGGQILNETKDGVRQVIVDVDGDIRVREKDTYQTFQTTAAGNPQMVLTSDANGIVSFANLPYGDYEFVEDTTGLTLIKETAGADIFVRINATGVFAKDTNGDYAIKLTEADGTGLTAVNQMQYGYVQINKVVEEISNHTPKLTDGKTIPVAGAVFGVYKVDSDNDDSNDVKVMELTTNKDGQFDLPTALTKPETGKETPLYVGSYYLKELTAPSGYTIVSDNKYSFNIAENTTIPFEPATVTAGKEYTIPAVTYILNTPNRGAVNLTKVDADYTANANAKLSGAEFDVYAKRGNEYVKVAELNDKVTSNVYKLSGNSSTPLIENENGVAYLHNYSSTATADWKILPGTYYLKETQVPKITIEESSVDAYVNPDADRTGNQLTRQITIAADGSGGDVLSQGGTSGKITNTIIKKSFTVKKYVEKRMSANPLSDETVFQKYETAKKTYKFLLTAKSGSPFNLPSGSTWTAYDASADDRTGIVAFNNIPLGDYVLTEIKVPQTDSVNNVQIISPIYVKVRTTGVSFYSDESYNAPLTTLDSDAASVLRLSASKATGVYTNGTANPEIVAYNNLNLGSITGTKYAKGNATNSGENGVALSGIQFNLMSGTTVIATTTSDGDGKFEFVNIPYGKYTVEEVPSDANRAYVVNSSMSVTLNQSSKTVTTNGNVVNNLILTKVKFAKVDQNNKKLTNTELQAKFTVERQEGPAIAPEIYTPTEEVTKENTGDVVIDNLPYGTYKITEVLEDSEKADKLHTGATTSIFYIVVGQNTASGKSGETKVEIFKANADGTKSTTSLGSISKASSAANDLYDFTADSFTNRYSIAKNIMKYGWVNLTKVRAELDSKNPDTYKAVSGGEMQNVEYKIYRATKTGSSYEKSETTPTLTLRTNASGQLARDTNGAYGGTYLLKGSYIIEETLPGTNFYQDGGKSCGFDVVDNEVTWIGYQMNEEGAAAALGFTTEQKAENETSTLKYFNIPKRGSMSLTKVDSVKFATLSNAVFGVKNSNGTLVAYMVEQGTTGTYKLSNTAAGYDTLAVNYAVTQNVEGIKGITVPYLSQTTAGDWNLLAGTYDVWELKAPANYAKPKTAIATGVVVTDGQPTEVKTIVQGVANTLRVANIDINKMVEANFWKATENKYVIPYESNYTFTFELTGTTADGTQIATGEKRVSVTGTKSAQFANIPIGQYTITEVGTQDDSRYVTNGQTFNVLVEADDTKTTDGTGTKVTIKTPDGKVQNTFYNDLKRFNIPGIKVTKVGTADKAVKDAKFGLYSDERCKNPVTDDGTATGTPIETTTDANGYFLFKNIPYGEYWIKETKAPTGYELSTASYKIEIKDNKTYSGTDIIWDAQANPAVVNYTTVKFVETPIEVSVKLGKVDQNGNTVSTPQYSGVTFNLKRKLAEGDSNGLDELAIANLDAKGSDTKTGIESVNGVITLNRLVYGTYELTETDGQNKITDDTQVKVTIKVEPGTTSGTKVTVTRVDGSTGESGHEEPIDNQAASTPFDFTSEEHIQKIVNTVNYGYLDITKVRGEKSGDGSYVTATGSDGKAVTLTGVKFEVYSYTTNINEATKYMTLVTNSDGKFEYDTATGKMKTLKADGETEWKALLAGKYYIQEVSDTAPTGYKKFTEKIPFEVGSTSGNHFTVTYNGVNKDVVEGATASNQSFMNIPVRRGLIFVKQDAETKDKLKNAVFGIKVHGESEVIAYVVESDRTNNPGVYDKLVMDYTSSGLEHIQGLNPITTKVAPTGSTISYAGGNDTDGYQLIPGTYDLYELEAPAAWYKPVSNTMVKEGFTISNTIAENVKADLGTINNTINKVSFKINKLIQKVYTKDFTDGEYQALTDTPDSSFGFTLDGFAANGTRITRTATASNGVVEFKDIPSSEGTYTITETGRPANYVDDSTVTMTVTVTADKKIVFNGKNFADESLINTVHNNLKRGNITGTKYAEGYGKKAGVNGATITLYDVDPSSDAWKDKTEAELDAAHHVIATSETAEVDGHDGVFEFKNIPWKSATGASSYWFRETIAPTGYHLNGTVYTAVINGTADSNVVTVKDASGNQISNIVDEPVLSNVLLKKIDQDGNLVSTADWGVTFKLTRVTTEDSNGWDDAAIAKLNANGAVAKTGIKSEKGIITLDNLVYGEYILTETDQDGKVADASAVEIRIKVEKGTDIGTEKTTKITVTRKDGSTNGNTQTSDSTQVVSSTSPAEFDFSNEPKAIIVNTVNYALLKIEKVRGEKSGTNSYAAATQSNGSMYAMKDVTFEVYKILDDSEILYMTLKTDEYGKFNTGVGSDANKMLQTDGSYKSLLAGRYYIKEVSDSSDVTKGYADNNSRMYFTVAKNAETFVVSYDGVTATASNAAADKTKVFMNIPERGKLTFEKHDKDLYEKNSPNSKLSGAVFGVAVLGTDKILAYVVESDRVNNPGVYDKMVMDYRSSGLKKIEKLNPIDPSKNIWENNIPYAGGNDTVGYQLVPGTTANNVKYVIYELEAPAAWYKPVIKTPVSNAFTITNNGTINLGIITNEINKIDISITKWIEKTYTKDFENTHYQVAGEELNGEFEFELKGNPLNGDEIIISNVTTNVGIATFSNVPAGTYKITETKRPANYEKDADEKSMTVVISEDLKKITFNGKTLAQNTEANVIENNLKRGKITGTKITEVGSDDIGVNGATITLYDVDPTSDEWKNKTEAELKDAGHVIATSVTAEVDEKNGVFVFDDIPWQSATGTTTYWFRETAAPEGYILSKEVHTAVISGEATKNEVAVEYPTGAVIKETPIQVNVKLAKVDQNGDPLKSTTLPVNFTVTRVTKDGEGNQNGLLDHSDKESPATASNAEDGTITLENLTYGTYELIEESAKNPHVSDAKNDVKITIEIKKDDTTGKLKVTITNNTQKYKDEYGNEKPRAAVLNEDQIQNGYYNFTADQYMKIVNTVDYGLIQIQKIMANVNDDGTLTPTRKDGNLEPLAGVVFEVYKDTNPNGEIDTPANGTKPFLTMVTGKDGRFKVSTATETKDQYLDRDGNPQSNRLIFGEHYLLHEVISATGNYKKPEAYYRFNLDKIKEDGNNNMVYVGAVADADGKISLKPGITNGIQSVIGAAGEDLLFPNAESYRGTIELKKYDSEKYDSAKGETWTLNGAEFDVYAATGSNAVSNKVAKLTDQEATGTYKLTKVSESEGYVAKNENGQYYLYDNGEKITILPGKYYLVETKAPAGYIKDETTRWTFTVEDGKTDVVLNEDLDKPLTNVVYRYPVQVQKYVEDPNARGSYHTASSDDKLSEAGAAFKLVGTPANAAEFSAGPVNIEEKMNADGVVTFENIPSGTYILSESFADNKAGNMYLIPDEIQITVDEDGVHYGDASAPVADKPVRVDNTLKRGSISGVKHTNGFITGQYIDTIPLKGVTFTLTAKDPATEVSKKVTKKTYTTGDDGRFVFDDLPLGKYVLEEIEAPKDYIIIDKPVEIEITEHEQSFTSNPKFTGYSSELIFMNDRVKGFVSVTKEDLDTDDILKDAEFTLYKEDGTEVCKLVYDENSELYVLPDPASSYSKGDWNTLMYYSNENHTPALYAGTYVVREIKAPNGYIRDTEDYKIVIAENNKTVPVSNTKAGKVFTNTKARGMITITKQKEVVTDSLTGTWTVGEGFEFRITGTTFDGVDIQTLDNGELDINGTSNYEFKEDGIHVVTGATGVVTIGNVPKGEYQVQEVDNAMTSIGGSYVLDTKTYDADITVNTILNHAVDASVSVDNKLKRSNITGLKVRSNGGTALAGATMGLYKEGTVNFATEDLYYGLTAVSDSEGHFTFENIPYGKYLIREISSPSGYNVNRSTVYIVDVTENGQTVTTGYLKEGNADVAVDKSEIKIVNTKTPSGGGGGGGGGNTPKPSDPTNPNNPTQPVGPGVPTTPETPVNPTEPVTPTNPFTPGNPDTPTVPAEPTPGGGTHVEIPPEIPHEPGTIVEVYNPNDPDVPLWRGPLDENGNIPLALKPGEYGLTILDDEGVPLGNMMFTIPDDGVPLGAPNAGDHTLPYALLITILLAGMGGTGIILKKRTS